MLRCFAGLTVEQTAEATGVSPGTVKSERARRLSPEQAIEAALAANMPRGFR
jgi:DNA-directed RNA polymerase specialized sigma24 family protein